MILLLDHDDSFVFTLASYVEAAGETPSVRRVRGLSLSEVVACGARGIILSPGPGGPEACQLAQAVVRTLGPVVPILGVCLGHQVIATALGASVGRAVRPRHGMTSPIRHDQRGIFSGIPTPLTATRYHSLAVLRDSIPAELELSAIAVDDDTVMGVRHRTHRIEGVQFHPESVLTDHGVRMIRNFLDRC